MTMPGNSTIRVGGKSITLSKLDKVLYPAAHYTKASVIDYYRRIAPFILPHLQNRALTLKQYPNGAMSGFFYEKRCPAFRPPWFKTVSIWSETNGDFISYCVVNDLPSLVWLANLATLELHVSLARARNPDAPGAVVFDLDPGSGAGVLDCAQVALWLRELLQEKKLQSFAKTSGSKGLQIYAPLNTPGAFAKSKQFARDIAETLASQHPDKVVAQMARRLRTKKVFIDWVQNDPHKTTICAYSLRAREQPTVSTPVNWNEIEGALRTKVPEKLVFTADAVLARVEKRGICLPR